MRRAALPALLAAAALFGAARGAAAEDAGIDVSALEARVEAALADETLPASLRPPYEKLARTLAQADRPGLADDFSKLDRTATLVVGPLFADTVLSAALDAALAEGLDEALPAEDLAIARVAAIVSAPMQHRSIEGHLRTARTTADAAIRAREIGRTDVACKTALQAARRYAVARRVSAAGVRRQDRRRPSWKIVLEGRAGSLLSIHVGPGSVPDVYVVGANDGGGPQFLRGGGEGFVRVPIAEQGDLWWVDDVPGAGIWACGTGGRVVRYDPATGAVADVSLGALGTASTLYGIWGSGPDDVWSVGDGTTGGHTVLHWDGEGWTPADLPAEAAGREVFKVWGSAHDDVWACGRGGLLLHWDGLAWTAVPSGTATTLLTVHGSGTRVTAVGQVIGAAIVERGRDGAFAASFLPPSVPSVSGVFLPAKGDAWAVGYIGTVLRRTRRGWRSIPGVPGSEGRDLHAVAIDDAGGVWVAGGDIIPSLDDGALLYFGPRTPEGGVVTRASFRSRVQPTLFTNCVEFGCHGGQSPIYVDARTPESSRATTVGRRSFQSKLLRVLPGRPSLSYLVHKLEGTHVEAGGLGERMPQGRDPLPLADLEAVRAWILEGAPDSE